METFQLLTMQFLRLWYLWHCFDLNFVCAVCYHIVFQKHRYNAHPKIQFSIDCCAIFIFSY